jgi:hypothetical protein
MLKTKFIDPIIDRIVDRVSDRVAQLLNEHALSSSKTVGILDAQHSATDTARQDSDLVARRRDELGKMSYVKVIGELPPPQEPAAAPRRRSELCKQADFSLDAYRYWNAALGLTPRLHRKHWEFFYVCQGLYERRLLSEGRTGLAFGVGREPLPALFAALGYCGNGSGG